MAYVHVYDSGGGIRNASVPDDARSLIGTTTDGGTAGVSFAAELAAIGYVGLSPQTALAGNYGYGVAPCPHPLPAGFTPMSGVNDPLSAGYGGYLTSDGSWMRWRPREYRKIGDGTNGLAINAVSVLPGSSMSIVEANNQGYFLPSEFYRAGIIQPGYFIDQFGCSLGSFNGQSIAVSVPNGKPLSCSITHNPISALSGSINNNVAGLIDAAKTRGSEYFVALASAYHGIAMSTLAHAQASQNASVCQWYDNLNITNFPRGNNNGALGDSVGGVLYVTDGFQTYGLTGSGVPFAMTTHNGQACGVSDISGNMSELAMGLIVDGTGSGYYLLSTNANPSTITSGNSLVTDHWGAASIAANYVSAGATYGGLTNSGTNKLIGNAGQVFSSALSGTAWLAQCCGIPLVGGVGGTNTFGNDLLGDYRPADACAAVGGHLTNTTLAGVFAINMNVTRANTSNTLGFRCMRYLAAGSFS